MHFNTILNSVDNRSDSAPLSIPDEWFQGRTAFGGILTAMIVKAIKSEVDDQRLLSFVTTSFINPLTPDVSFKIVVSNLPEGRSVTHMEGRAIQEGKTIAVVLAGLGVPRELSINIEGAEAPVVLAPEKGFELTYIPNVSPKYFQNFNLSQVLGDLPFTGSKRSQMGGWMRFKDDLDEITDAHVIALIDAWPVGILPMLDTPSPMSTLSWNIEFIFCPFFH